MMLHCTLINEGRLPVAAVEQNDHPSSGFLIEAARHPHCRRVLVIWGSVGIAVPSVAVVSDAVPILAAPAIFLAGGMVWSLIEYLLHRHGMHWEPRSLALLRLRETVLPHMNHHRNPGAPNIVVMRKQQIPAALILAGFLALWTVAPAGPAAVFMSGIGAGYMLYELVHFSIHQCNLTSRMTRRLKQHHLHHHFRNESVNFGVTTPIWDHVFGTHFQQRSEVSDERGRDE